jgi:hypothetical protein
MRVKILSGNQAGCVGDFPQVEGEVLIATGYGELVAEEPPVAVEPSAPAPEEPSVRSRSSRKPKP